MSFFTESSDDKTIILFSTHADVDPFKIFLSNLGGTFFRELASKNGNKYPAWIFESSKRREVEKFVEEHNENDDDSKSISSMPDIELLFDEIFRRIENVEKDVEDILSMLDSQK